MSVPLSNEVIEVPQTPAEAVAQQARAATEPLWSVILETTKPRIVRLVTITAGVGFGVSALGRSWTVADLVISAIGCVAGTGFSAAGANTLNQWLERDRDALMKRTCTRPLPQGRLTPGTALWAGVALSVLGVAILWAMCGLAAALVSLATILSYVLIYTPLKPVTSLATLIGAVPGALPPMIGWCAGAAGATSVVAGLAETTGWPEALLPLREAGGWSLFILMFVWQIPHFLAIAWMYREDYARGGYRVMPVVDGSLKRTASTMLIWSVLMIPASLLPVIMMRGGAGGASGQPGPGVLYTIVAVLSGLVILERSLRVAQKGTREAARSAFIASVIQLPIVMGALLLDTALSAVL